MRDILLNHLLPSFIFLLLSSHISLISSSSPLATAQHGCLNDQRSALVQLQHDLRNDSPTSASVSFSTNSSLKVHIWDLKTDCCTWEGVSCDTTGHVIELDLSYRMLSGRINSIFHLSHLQRLNLAGNNFEHTRIPSGFARLGNLTHLNLSSACFSGQIPLEISRLTRLVSIDLSYTTSGCSDIALFYLERVEWEELHRLKLKKPNLITFVQNLSSLTELYLDNVDLSAEGTNWWEALSYTLPNLRVLSLFHCGLSGAIKPAISHLHFLSKLHLSYNHLSSVPSNFLENFSNLETLILTACELQGNFPKNIFLLPKLRLIDISYNPLLTGVLPEFSLDNALQVLSLHTTNFYGKLPNSIGNLKFLTTLRLDQCSFSGLIPSSLANLTRIVKLDLSGNGFIGSIPPFHSIGVPNLARLHLSHNQLDGESYSSLFTVSSLQELYLEENQFSGQLDEFQNSSFSLLEYVSLAHNDLQGPIPKSISGFPRLRYLSLAHNNLSGTIKLDMFQNLHYLTSLDLSDNSLSIESGNNSFTIPLLEDLRLSSCNISEFPAFLTKQVKLRNLDLSDNNLSIESDNSSFTFPQLENLSLSSCNITQFPDFLRKQDKLRSLDLSDNSLSIESDNSSFTFPQLVDLQLSSCNITQFPDFLRKQDKLRSLDLSNNQIHGYVPSWFWKSTLVSIDLSRNAIDFLEQPPLGISNHSMPIFNKDGNDSISMLDTLIMSSCNISRFPEFLKNQDELQILDLSDNKIQGQIPNWIWKKDLFYLNLSHNFLNALDHQFLPNASFASLETLDLHFNELQGSLPKAICNSTLLFFLDASHNHLSGSIPECLGKIGTLSVLNVQRNNFHGMLPNFGQAGSLLWSLNINGNEFEGQLPRSLANCTMLEVLDLGNNKIVDAFPFWLEKLPSLKVLVLRANIFYGPIGHPGIKYVFPKLHIMDLSSNEFTGVLSKEFFRSLNAMAMINELEPAYIGKYDPYSRNYYHYSVTIMNKGLEMELVRILSVFTSLDLSNNRFYGEIPKEIGDLKSLIVINMSQNDFISQIPSSLGNLSELESLDLSQNNLSGKIPSQLTSLTFLAVLNLSYNQLEGSIPQGNQFHTFSNDSYKGNVRLCGLPLSKKCREDNDAMPPTLQGESYESTSIFDWKAAWMGYVGGIVIGFAIGYTILCKMEHIWFMDPRGRGRKNGRRLTRGCEINTRRLS